jgi:hypothetical protein
MKGEGMRPRLSWRVPLAAGAIAVLAVAGAALIPGGGSSAAPSVGDEMPTALAGHLAELRQAVPGNQGMSEGPGGAAESAYMQRAYPDQAISLADAAAARSAFTASKGREAPKGKGKKGTWVLVGPSRAL